MTVPTPTMLHASCNATYKDDVYREDSTTEELQAEMAKLLGHEDAIFMISGTMSNQVALRSLLTQPPHSVLCDSRGHIIHFETGGVASLSGASIQPVEARNKKYLTLEDVKTKAVLDDYVQFSPTKVVSLENTLNGVVYPLEEIKKISAFARENDIKMHLDGARLWDAVVAGGGSLYEYAQQFDTVNLCFSKGLGAAMGSMLVGSKKTIAQARKIRQSIGGGMHQAGMLTAMARVSFEETFGGRVDGKGSLLARGHRVAKHIAEDWVRHGGKLLSPSETCMVFLDLKDIGLSRPELRRMSEKVGLDIRTERLVVHYRRSSKRSTKVVLMLRQQRYQMKRFGASRCCLSTFLRGRK